MTKFTVRHHSNTVELRWFWRQKMKRRFFNEIFVTLPPFEERYQGYQLDCLWNMMVMQQPNCSVGRLGVRHNRVRLVRVRRVRVRHNRVRRNQYEGEGMGGRVPKTACEDTLTTRKARGRSTRRRRRRSTGSCSDECMPMMSTSRGISQVVPHSRDA